ncbi:MAG: hypothetical protein KFB93_06530 [Simkaniaceae bacterium]|nr:MAG: hypothetical protein KFB93_06530 [Simkaniaceae bacterium]
MEGKLSYLEAFKSMPCSLEKYYEQTHSADVSSLLGDISLDMTQQEPLLLGENGDYKNSS